MPVGMGGINRDGTKFTTVSQVDGHITEIKLTPQKVCCGSVPSTLDKVVEAVRGVAAAVAVATGIEPEASHDVQERRLEICRACTAVDSTGDRLFRGPSDNPTCGVPFGDHVIRDRSKEGCGCYLRQKVRGANQQCPLDPPKWTRSSLD